jgi:hypothetical protein
MEHEVHIGKVEVERLNATILKKSAKIGEYKTKIGEITSRMLETEALLKTANEAREKEQGEFVEKEKSLTEEISLMEHILQVLPRSPTLSQLKSATTLTESFQVLVQDSVLNSFDASRLMTLASRCNTSKPFISSGVSSGQEEAAVDSEGGVTVGMDRSGEFTSALINLTAQAKVNLLEARKIEAKALEAHILQNEALSATLRQAKSDLKLEEKALTGAERMKKTTEGDIFLVAKKSSQDSAAFQEAEKLCKQARETVEQQAEKYQKYLHSMKAAKEEIKRTTRDAADLTYTSNVLFAKSGQRIVNIEALKFIRNLARESKSMPLLHLAANMSAAVITEFESRGDPFSQLKTLLGSHMALLEAKEAEEATQKADCEKATSDAESKKASIRLEHVSDAVLIEKYMTASANAAKSNSRLASIYHGKAVGSKLRLEQKEAFEKDRVALQTGLDGVMKAQDLLKDLHSEKSYSDAAIRIWEFLVRCQTDFTKGLNKLKADEAEAVANHEAYLDKVQHETESTASDASRMTDEVAALYKSLTESAPETADDFDAMSNYDKIKADCESRDDVHGQQERRRSEIDALKKASKMLQEDEGLVHTVAKRRNRQKGFLSF